MRKPVFKSGLLNFNNPALYKKVIIDGKHVGWVQQKFRNGHEERLCNSLARINEVKCQK